MQIKYVLEVRVFLPLNNMWEMIIFAIILLILWGIILKWLGDKEIKKIRRQYDEQNKPIKELNRDANRIREDDNPSSIRERGNEAAQVAGGHTDFQDTIDISPREDESKPGT